MEKLTHIQENSLLSLYGMRVKVVKTMIKEGQSMIVFRKASAYHGDVAYRSIHKFDPYPLSHKNLSALNMTQEDTGFFNDQMMLRPASIENDSQIYTDSLYAPWKVFLRPDYSRYLLNDLKEIRYVHEWQKVMELLSIKDYLKNCRIQDLKN